MINVHSKNKAITPGKDRLDTMKELAVKAAPHSNRKIMLGLGGMFALIAYMRSFWAPGEVNAQTSPAPTPQPDEAAAPELCETLNLSEDLKADGAMRRLSELVERGGFSAALEGGVERFSAIEFRGTPLERYRYTELFQEPLPTAQPFVADTEATAPPPGPQNPEEEGTPGNPGTPAGPGDTGEPDPEAPTPPTPTPPIDAEDNPAGGEDRDEDRGEDRDDDKGGERDDKDENDREDDDRKDDDREDDDREDDDHEDDDREDDDCEDDDCEDDDHEDDDHEDDDREDDDHEGDDREDDDKDEDKDQNEAAACDICGEVHDQDDTRKDEEKDDEDSAHDHDDDHDDDRDDDLAHDHADDSADHACDSCDDDHNSDSAQNSQPTPLVWGTDGDDLLMGTQGNDAISGGAGDDVIQGVAGHNLLRGDAGNDTLQGGSGTDHLSGDDGDDTLFDGAGADILAGGAGHDRLVLAADDDADIAHGGAGFDRLDISSAKQHSHVDFATGAVQLDDGPADQMHEIEEIFAGNAADEFDFSALMAHATAKDGPGFHQITNFGRGDTLRLGEDMVLDFNSLSAPSDSADAPDMATLEGRMQAARAEHAETVQTRLSYQTAESDGALTRSISVDFNNDGSADLQIDILLDPQDRLDTLSMNG